VRLFVLFQFQLFVFVEFQPIKLVFIASAGADRVL
jgi:hypothetical protein